MTNNLGRGILRRLRASRASIERLDAEISNSTIQREVYEKRLQDLSGTPWSTAIKKHLDRANRCLEAGHKTAGYDNLFAAERELIAGMDPEEREKRLQDLSGPPWSTATKEHIDRATKCSKKGHIIAGYDSLFAAERALIAGMSPEERKSRAISLLEEAPKLGSSWRRQAVLKLLGKQPDKVSIASLQEAMGHIQTKSQNIYRNIEYLKHQLTLLSVVLGALVSVIVSMATWGHLYAFDAKSEDWLGLAVLFGLMGGALSAMFTVAYTPKGKNIPDELRNGPLMLVRPLLGGAVAIPIYVFMRSGLIEFTTLDSKLAPILALGFIGGFSERWFLKKIGQISGIKHDSQTSNENESQTSNEQSPKTVQKPVSSIDLAQTNRNTGNRQSLQKTPEPDSKLDAANTTFFPHFRAGVGAVVASNEGKVLLCQRADIPAGAWQFPQGGIEEGETPAEAVKRELREEIGVDKEQLVELGNVEGWLTYELPIEMQNTKVGRGQLQRWFLFRISAEGEKQIEPTDEFNAFKWVSMQQAVDAAARFRKPIYERLQSDFSNMISSL